MSVRAGISIRDNVSAVLRSVKKEQSDFRKDVEKTKKAMKEAYDKKRKLRVDTAPATKAIKKLNKKLHPFRKKMVKAVAVKDMATAKFIRIKAKAKAFSKMTFKPVIGIKDRVSSGIGAVKGKIAPLIKGITIPIALGGIGAVLGAVAGLGKSIGMGSQLEQQKISMEHFIGATNTEMDSSQVKNVAEQFTNDLRANANATPFETGEVISAGARAIAVASGDTKEAMGLVKLAEDMAAASGGTKSISDAMEALADAKLGETERLKEFGFKVSKEEFDSKGFKGVADDLGAFYGGASEKLAESGAGIFSTITGKLKSTFADIGLGALEELKPLLKDTVGIIDRYTPTFMSFGKKLASGLGVAVEGARSFAPVLKSVFSTVKPVISGIYETIVPTFKEVALSVGNMAVGMAPVVKNLVGVLGNTFKSVVPVLKTVAINLYSAIIPVASSVMSTLSVIIPAVVPVISSVVTTVSDIIASASPIISGVVTIIGETISTLAPVFSTIFDSIGEKVGTVVEFVSSRMGFVHEVFDTVVPLVADILKTSWKVISPVLDIAVGAFKMLWSAVEFVFPAVRDTIETVWSYIKPVVEGIAKGLDTVASGWEWLVGKVTGESTKSVGTGVSVGKNALGTDNWRGGLTWVGEKGAELVDLPKGSRILPNKTSARLMENNFKAPSMTFVEKSEKGEKSITINIPKLADSIIVREEADIEKILDKLMARLVAELKMAKLVEN